MNKKWIAGVLAGLVIVGGVLTYKTYAGAQSVEAEEKVEKTTTVTKGDIVIDLVSDGNVEIPIYDLSFEETGTIKTVNISVGDYVEKGEVLAEQENEDLERSLTEAKLNLEVALKEQEMNLKSYSEGEKDYAYQSNLLWENYEKEKDDLDTMLAITEAYAQSEIDDQQKSTDDAYKAYNNYIATSKPDTSIKTELDAITVEKARMKIEEIEEQIEGTIINANVSGYVVDVKFKAGEVIESAQTVILLEEDGPIYVETSVPEDDIGDISVGQKAIFEADAVAGITYDAKVTQVSRSPETSSNGLVSYSVRLEADEIDRQLMDGMTATVNFILIERNDVLILPNKAIEKRDGGQYVQVMADDGSVVDTKIAAGFTDGTQVEILSGLEAGATVAYEE